MQKTSLRTLRETYTGDLQKRPIRRYIKRDQQKRPTPWGKYKRRANVHQERLTKETYKRDLQKRPTKETCKRDLQKRPAKETSKRDIQTRPTPWDKCNRQAYLHQERPTKETYKRDLQKRPTKETCKRDLHKRPTKNAPTYIKRD